MASIDEILAGLGSEELEELKNALFKQMSEAVNDAPGQMLLYNRSPDEFEFQWDSKPYCIPGHKYVQLPLGIARMAVLKSRYSGIGTSEVESWVVPRGAEGFGVPMKTMG